MSYKKIVWHSFLHLEDDLQDEVGFIEYAAMKIYFNKGIRLNDIVTFWNETIISDDLIDINANHEIFGGVSTLWM